MITNSYSLTSQARAGKAVAEKLGHGRGTLLFTLCEYVEVTTEIGIEPEVAFLEFAKLYGAVSFRLPVDPTKKEEEELPTAKE